MGAVGFFFSATFSSGLAATLSLPFSFDSFGSFAGVCAAPCLGELLSVCAVGAAGCCAGVGAGGGTAGGQVAGVVASASLPTMVEVDNATSLFVNIAAPPLRPINTPPPLTHSFNLSMPLIPKAA